MTFNDLNINTPLRNALEDLELVTPTPIQVAAYPIIMSGKDVVGVAQTGTGKTFAYLLPILRQLVFSKLKYPRVLILVPTRELVVQVVGEIEKLTTYMSVRVKGAYGGVNMNTQVIDLAEGMDILVATPGRLVDLALSHAIKLNTVKQFVIDEMDEMLQLGFKQQLSVIMDLLPERRQNILFSATLTTEIEKLIDKEFFEPQKVEVAASGTSADGIDQKAYLVPNYTTKINLLLHLLRTQPDWKKILIFAETKKIVDHLFEVIEANFPGKAGVIHSNKSQNYRLRTVENFDSGEHSILLATDLIARGLDFEGVTHVINVDTPNEAENYIHRVGRTARANTEGVAITFVNQIEVTEELLYLEAIETLMNKKIEILPLPEGLEISDVITKDEIITYRQKNPGKKNDALKHSQGAFHEKLAKNLKVNLAQEKRLARKKEKYDAKRHGKKK